MSLVTEIRSALDRLSIPSHTPQTLTADAAGQRLTLHLADVDSLACGFTSLEFESQAFAQAGIEQLKLVADKLAKRLTYLLEPISPIEHDAEHCVVQLRSNPPQRDEDRTSYYELLVSRGGRLSLVRYAKPAGGLRQPITSHVTREVLLRLVGDFAQVSL
ncbi:MAG TPA: hypothetical protein VHV55_14885 [Pirellulales bacterium]|jgi:hypothetical protein|nr:hypothetical protein [Pirellulales bacterium]